VILEPTGTDRLLGQTFYLHWLSYGDVCVTAGGGPNDGWANNSFNAANNVDSEFAPHVTAVGTIRTHSPAPRALFHRHRALRLRLSRTPHIRHPRSGRCQSRTATPLRTT